ncbi:MAG TPA: hypothetical protein PKW48_07695 [Deltaproteobacteria bacterium]|jgi:hypothetical protein|nr:hypothetical protein [Deltaproteobacteria bacterium]HQQ15612.1 hypothetical protein [Deltaproteobacteria bacterium]
MKILDTDICMSSSRTYLEKDDEQERMRFWIDRAPARNASGPDRVTISSDALSRLQECRCGREEDEMISGADQEISLRRLITEILSGREVRIIRIDESDKSGHGLDEADASTDADQRRGWGLEYDYERLHVEKEDVGFTARGVVRTADGKEAAFVLKLEMNREYIEKNHIRIRAGDAAIDPLVINFDGNAADLSPVKFEFDLDFDGISDHVSIPTAGRGFLAIDLNGDGIINNGSELFGPRTGNGFGELASYDTDGNSWIDENDEVFHRLKIMTVDNRGVQSLSNLKDMNVGAVYLGAVPTLFDVRTTSDNTLLGQVHTTGLYLREDGTPGTIQQLDLVA